MLRIGRTGLYYQTRNGKQSGVWDKENQVWTMLDASHHRAIRRAIRIAAKKMAPDLLMLPVNAPEMP